MSTVPTTSCPSGALTGSLHSLIKNHTAAPGLTLLTGQTRSGQSSGSVPWLPTGETGWHVHSADREYLVEATVRLRELLLAKFPGENTSVVNEVFRRGAYPGTVHALRFCERYLMSGGTMSSLPKVGQIVLTLKFDTARFTAGNVESISCVSVALYDSMYHPDMIPPILELAFEYDDRGVDIAALITERSITDAESIRGLLGESGSMLRVVNNGVL